MFDPYKRDKPGLGDPATNIIPITPSDDSFLRIGVKALRIVNMSEEFADLVIETIDGDTIPLKIPPMCLWTEPVRVKRVLEATTDGLLIHGYTDWPTEAAE